MGRKRIETQVKWQIVAYYKLNYHPNQIAALCNCSRGCVVNTIRNWNENGGVGDKIKIRQTACINRKRRQDAIQTR